MDENRFSSVDLDATLVKNLGSLGYEQMTPVQAQSLPLILSSKDVIAKASTGSGKTAAFGLGILQQLKVKQFRIQSLILCPTRELADQVAEEIRRLARSIHNIKILTLCGGAAIGPQIGSLEHGAHIVVGTPGRIGAHLRKGTLNLATVQFFVLDEADRMLDMGFQDEIDKIVSYLPSARQTLLFSATFPSEILDIAKRVMKEPIKIEVSPSQEPSTIDQYFYEVGSTTSRQLALKMLLLFHQANSAIIFCSTRVETQEICDELRLEGFSAMALHGEMDQSQREQAFVMIANNSVSILVATDVAARGLDIDDLDLVINYHLAQDAEIHVHRIGRTGRAGSRGIACTLFKANQQYKLDALADFIKQPLQKAALPAPSILNRSPNLPVKETIRIDGGKKQKIRAGDILGALTGKDGIAANQVGKIHLYPNRSFVAVDSKVGRHAFKKLNNGKIKGRKFRVRRISR